jgi:RND family efflux transporter MFP subunit
VIGAELGDQVRAGQELARLEDDEEQAAVAVATAAHDLTRLEYDRAAQLAENGMATRAELETATYRLRAAESALRDAEIRLAYTRVTTPFAGAITRRFVRVGQLVEMGEPLFRTTALSPLRALLRIPELEAQSLATGQPVTFHGVGAQEATGRILRVAPAVDPVSGTVEVLVDVAEPRGMRPGSAVRARLERRASPER